MPAIGDPGRAAREVTSGVPPERAEIPDHALSEHCVPGLQIRAASLRGLMHRHHGTPRQDAYSVTYDQATATTVVVVCDGVGSLPRSGEAAAFVTTRLPDLYRLHRDWTTAVQAVNDELLAHVERTLAGLKPEQRAANEMATTVVAAAIAPDGRGMRASVVRSDDSTAWLLGTGGSWLPVSALEEAGDAAVHTGAVRALPQTAVGLHHAEVALDGVALFVMTDGVGTPLADSAEVRDTLAAWWAGPPPVFEFGRQVGFDRRSHLDDRTVVGVWHTIAEPDGGDAER